MKPGYQTYRDTELLQLIADNDETAFGEIYNRYASDMFMVAFNILHHKAGAEDAVQEIFISIWRRRAELDIQQSLSGYLTRAVRYYVLRAYKEEKRDELFHERLKRVTLEILDDDPVVYRDIHRTLQRIISGLPSDQQLIYKLSRDHHMTYLEIARHLDISIKTVEKKMSQALRTIRPRMDQLLLIWMFLGNFRL